MDKVMRMSSEKGVVIFTKSSCCLCYTVQILFRDLRVQPTIHEIDNDPDCREIEKALLRIGCSTAVPAVFVGGKLYLDSMSLCEYDFLSFLYSSFTFVYFLNIAFILSFMSVRFSGFYNIYIILYVCVSVSYYPIASLSFYFILFIFNCYYGLFS
ncbi:hypothetical protein F2Q70_00028963 [Brassica cretica]|uniref:Glutaredoxin domain-containing protein n=1 Tax=Brassica cretica TaxID=69181 RepID=A0A8S9LGV7_BRACR|nr:hypothetical protein F2Q70_00028963 [Brassica cretica]